MEEEDSVKVKCQKPLIYNQYLPYYEHIEEEANEFLENIKKNLSIALQRHELKRGCVYWTNQLQCYLRMYGYHFTKEDHIKLIKLLYELVTMPGLEAQLVRSWCYILIKLLKKSKLLSRDDLVLPWQPLFALVKEVFYSKQQQLGIVYYSNGLSDAVNGLIKEARLYFPVETTREVLEEWRPLMCPFDVTMIEGCNALGEFLPIVLKPEELEQGYKLWFDEFMALWIKCDSYPPWEDYLFRLFTRLAWELPGHPNWNPFIPQIFTRVLRSFCIPVGTSGWGRVPTDKTHGYDPVEAATLIVGMMGGDSEALDYLSKLMLALDSYYHPSNHGKHTRNLLSFMKELTECFVERLHRERFSKPDWKPQVPASSRLTEDDIDKFVGYMLPSLQQAMFAKAHFVTAAVAMQNLAWLRPERVLPDLLEKTYMALETLTEPHQLVSSLQCMTAVSRTLLSNSDRFPEGRSHFFSLLFLCLPGIDPNDFRKTLAVSVFLSASISLVPLVDCSECIGHHDMTETEKELCQLTRQFEDFVVQFLDRCFALVENCSLEQVTGLDRTVSNNYKNTHETLMGTSVSGALQGTLTQCSPQLFQIALDKLFRFASSHVFESEVAGLLCADMCTAAGKVNAEKTLQLFIPHCTSAINRIVEDPEQKESEHPDSDLIWNLQLMAQMLGTRGTALLSHADSVIECLLKCVDLKNKTAAGYAAKALRNVLHTLSQTYSMEARSIDDEFSLDPKEHCYIKDWAKPGDIHNLKMQWHLPSKEELKLVDRFLEEFLEPELTRLRAYMNGEPLEREDLNRRLSLINVMIGGAAAYLSPWDGEQLTEGCNPSCVPLTRKLLMYKIGGKEPPEKFSRKKLAEFCHNITEYILSHSEDDTNSQMTLIKIIKALLGNLGITRQEIENRWSSYRATKRSLEDKVHGNKRHIRMLLVARVQIQHEMRMVEQMSSCMTQLHFDLLMDLFKMSTSHYTQIRIRAQSALSHLVDNYLYSCRIMIPHVVPLLTNDPAITHEQFKGALYVLSLPQFSNMVVHNAILLEMVLPAIAKQYSLSISPIQFYNFESGLADHSEKRSIISLISMVLSTYAKRHDSLCLKAKVSDSVVKSAGELHKHLSDEEIQEGRKIMDEENNKRLQSYYNVTDALSELCESPELQWRFVEISMTFLVLSIHHKEPLPRRAVRAIVNGLVHDALAIRKICIKGMVCILWQQKRKTKRIPIDLKQQGVNTETKTSVQPGEREDTKWLIYDNDKVPKTAEEWDRFPFVNKTHWGYYSWPKVLYTYAPFTDQPKLDRTMDEIPEVEKPIYEAFLSKEFVDKFVSYLSLEEHKEKDAFDNDRYYVFKRLFNNFGDTFLHHFKPHLEKLGTDNQESNQRCACEIITGMISGSKHWSFDMNFKLREFLEPLLKEILKAVTVETIEDWGRFGYYVSANRDPRQISWILELLVDSPLTGNASAFHDTCRLYMLQSALAQQEWRVSSLQHQLVNHLQPHFSHQFKNVRNSIGCILQFTAFYDTPLCLVSYNVRVSELVEMFMGSTQKAVSLLHEDPDHSKEEINACKTALYWITDKVQKSLIQITPDMIKLFAILLSLIVKEEDEELVTLLKKGARLISHTKLSDECIKTMVFVTHQVVEQDVWKVTTIALNMLQVLIFENLFTFEPYIGEITELLLGRLQDNSIEVRELAATTISGLVRCKFIQTVDHLQKIFTTLSISKIKKRDNKSVDNLDAPEEHRQLVKRHAGVLGLAALVEACPYTIPEWLPSVLDHISDHLRDPAPIQATVKKVMSNFKRTHHDNWQSHKMKFTDEQLTSLSDLLVSPSYYA